MNVRDNKLRCIMTATSTESQPTYLNFLRSGLYSRLIAPSYLSYIIFLAILPATLIHKKNNKISENIDELDSDFLIKRALNIKHINLGEDFFILNYCNGFKKYYESLYVSLCNDYNVDYTSIGGIEKLELTAKSNSKKYSMIFAGNAQDAMHLDYINATSSNDKNRNYVFWNYPGVAGSNGIPTARDLIDAGVGQVKILLQKGVNAEDITLDGHSLGGAVAIQVAMKLYQEGEFVNLNVDRSFASVALFVPGKLEEFNLYGPLISSFVFFGIAGLSIGIGFAAIMSGLAKNIKASLNVFGLSYLGFVLDKFIGVTSSIIGGLIAVAGLIAGSIVGICIGSILKLQNVFTNNPYTLPMQLAFSIALNLACCEMNSSDTLRTLLNLTERASNKPKVSVVTTMQDEVIPFSASLQNAIVGDITHNSIIDMSDGDETSALKPSQQTKSTVIFTQYNKGSHNDVLNSDDIESSYVYKPN